MCGCAGVYECPCVCIVRSVCVRKRKKERERERERERENYSERVGSAQIEAEFKNCQES